MQSIYKLLLKLILLACLITNIIGRHVGRHNQSAALKRRHQITKRIAGGEWATIKGLYYQLYIIQVMEYICGATLVEVAGIHIALTANHCLWWGSPEPNSTRPIEQLRVCGGNGRLAHTKWKECLLLNKIVSHPEFDSVTHTDDIAIMFPERDFKETATLSGIVLPKHDFDIPHEVCVSGWGAEYYGGPRPNLLKYAWIPTTEQYYCQQFNHLPGVDFGDSHFCTAQFTGPKTGPCTTDNGSPAVAYNDSITEHTGGYYLAGIVTSPYADTCGDPEFPDAYVRVSKYVDWIEDEVRQYKIETGRSILINDY